MKGVWMRAMRRRMIWNDIRGNRLMSVTTWFFMAVSAFLLALTAYLAVSLLGSVDALMEQAKTPDFLQMHNGELDAEKLRAFAEEQKAVRDYQVLTFLNLENAMIRLNGHSLADSTQDNGVCVQSGSFDYLLDLENGRNLCGKCCARIPDLRYLFGYYQRGKNGKGGRYPKICDKYLRADHPRGSHGSCRRVDSSSACYVCSCCTIHEAACRKGPQ